MRFHGSGIIDTDQCGTATNHAVAIVGYTSYSSTENAWIVRNSWNTWWGDNGYVKIRKDSGMSAGICGIATLAYYPFY